MIKKFNILIVTQYFWPENFRINDFAEALTEQGHTVTVLTGLPNYPKGVFFSNFSFFGPFVQYYQNKIPVLRVPLIPRGKGRAFQLILNYLSFVFFASILGPLYLRKKNFDCIFVYEVSPITVALPAIVLKAIKKIPIYLWITDLWPESVTATQNITTPFILTPLKALVAFIYKHCDWLLMSSMAFERKILPLITQPEKLLYWPQWAENFYGPHLTNPHIPYFINLPKGFYIFFAGNIGEAQSFPTILETAFILKKYTDIYWVIIGDGRKKAWVLKKVKDLNLESQFHFIGPQPPSLIPSYFYYADALLISLKKDPIFELTIPSKLQSSLACGLPILGSIDGEGARIIEEAEAGLCAPSESASQLADIVLQMKSQSPQERQLYGKKGRDYFKKYFDREKMIHQFLHWVEEHQEHRKKRSSNPTNQVQTHVSTNHSA